MTTAVREPVTRSVGAELAYYSAALYARGWMEGTSGNVSVRTTAGTVVITASGRSKGELTPGDVVSVAPDTGEAINADDLRPSAETALHLALYRADPGCRAVIHAHLPYATALSVRAAQLGEEGVDFTDYELLKGLGLQDPSATTVPVFANHRDVGAIGRDIAAHFGRPGTGRPPLLLIARHGATAWGPDLGTARNRLECLEALSQLLVLDRQFS